MDGCVRVMVGRWGLPAWVAPHARRLQDALRREGPAGGRVPDGDEPVDRLRETLVTLSHLPREWAPSSPPEWSAFVRSALALEVATLSLSREADLPALLDVRGRWREWEGRVGRLLPDGVTLQSAVGDAQDVAEAFDRQVLSPARWLSRPVVPLRGRARREGGTHTGRSILLFSGQSLRGVVERSLRWHARRGSSTRASRRSPRVDAASPGPGGRASRNTRRATSAWSS